MILRIGFLVPLLIALLSLSCGHTRLREYRKPLDNAVTGTFSAKQLSQVSFEDRTEEVVGRAEALIEKNEREGTVLDERWYTLKRFGKFQDAIFGAPQVIFYGGLENDVQQQLQGQYLSIRPMEDGQDPGEIRLFLGARKGAPPDLIIIGQNGKEVALKTIIRLIYLARFADDETRRKYRHNLPSFSKSLKVFMSSRTAREEFVAFLKTHGVSQPDVVMIGFIGDTRSVLRDEGIADPESYADESLRVNWYANANGMKLLLVSIDGNRIFGSRSGELIEAILQLAGNNPPQMVFLGSGGAIDEPEIIGKIVAPAIVLSGDGLSATQDVPAQIIGNRALDQGRISTAHVSVENVIIETTQWTAEMKRRRIRTVDQELFHIVHAIHSSTATRRIKIFAGILVTDNVSSDARGNVALTLEHAEETITSTASLRRNFLSESLEQMGIVKHEKSRFRNQKEIAR